MIEIRQARSGIEAPMLPVRGSLGPMMQMVDIFLCTVIVLMSVVLMSENASGAPLIFFGIFMPGFWFQIRVMPFIPQLCQYGMRHDVILAGVDPQAFLEVNLMPHIKGALLPICAAVGGLMFAGLALLVREADTKIIIFLPFGALGYLSWIVALLGVAVLTCLRTIRWLCQPRPASMAWCWAASFALMFGAVISLILALGFFGAMCFSFSGFGSLIAVVLLAMLCLNIVKNEMANTAEKFAEFE